MGILNSFDRDTIFIINQNGDRSDLIEANVQDNKIFIHRTDVNVEDGDKIHRVVEGRKDEIYVVISAGYKKEFSGIPAHYQCTVKKESALLNEQKNSGHTVYNYNLHGDHNRVNNQSHDYSTNTSSQAYGADIETALKYLAEAKVEANLVAPSEGTSDTLNAVQEQLKSEKPSKHIMEILLKSLPDVVKAIPAISSLFTAISHIGK